MASLLESKFTMSSGKAINKCIGESNDKNATGERIAFK
jgi:hypothetical protein